MGIQHHILEILKTLPTDRQREVLDFAAALKAKNQSHCPRRSVKGLCADLRGQVTAEDIDEARREMWGDFPRGGIR